MEHMLAMGVCAEKSTQMNPLKNCITSPKNRLCYEHVLTRKNGAHQSHSAMVPHSKSGARRVKISRRGVLELPVYAQAH